MPEQQTEQQTASKIIGTIVKTKEAIYAVFNTEQEAEEMITVFPNYVRFACYGGYLNALVLKEIK